MKEKRGISDVVTTVLMILLVIAAIAIIWVVLSNFFKRGTNCLPENVDCISTSLVVNKAVYKDSQLSISLTKDRGASQLKNINFIIDGQLINSSQISPLPSSIILSIGELKTFIITGTGDKTNKSIEVQAVVENNCVCPQKSQPFTITTS